MSEGFVDIDLIKGSGEVIQIEKAPVSGDEADSMLFQDVRDVSEIINKHLESIKQLRGILNDPQKSFREKLSSLLDMKLAMLAPSLQVLLTPNNKTNNLIANNAKNVLFMINDLENTLFKINEYEVTQEIDFNNPKIQLSYKFLIDMIINELRVYLKGEEIEIFTQKLFVNLAGFEDEMNKLCSGVAFNLLETLKNPLVKDNS